MKRIPNQSRTLGETLKALRLGYYALDKIKCFLRIVPQTACFRIDIVPFGCSFIKGGKDERHFVWWDKYAYFDPTKEIPQLKNVKMFLKPFSFYVDDKGELIDERRDN